jgi:hypothetical protein
MLFNLLFESAVEMNIVYISINNRNKPNSDSFILVCLHRCTNIVLKHEEEFVKSYKVHYKILNF